MDEWNSWSITGDLCVEKEKKEKEYDMNCCGKDTLYIKIPIFVIGFMDGSDKGIVI